MNLEKIVCVEIELTDNEIKEFIEEIVNNFFEYSNQRVLWKNWEWCAWECWIWKNSKYICTAKCRNLSKYDNWLKEKLIEWLTNKIIEERDKWNFNVKSIDNYLFKNYINIKIKNILNKMD